MLNILIQIYMPTFNLVILNTHSNVCHGLVSLVIFSLLFFLPSFLVFKFSLLFLNLFLNQLFHILVYFSSLLRELVENSKFDIFLTFFIVTDAVRNKLLYPSSLFIIQFANTLPQFLHFKRGKRFEHRTSLENHRSMVFNNFTV